MCPPTAQLQTADEVPTPPKMPYMTSKITSDLIDIDLGIGYDQKKNATEECGLCDTSKTYEAYTLPDLKKYLALYGVARGSAYTDFRRGAWKLR